MTALVCDTGLSYSVFGPWGVQPFYQFWCFRTFRSRLIGQHLSHASRDLATLTFDLEGHGVVADARLRAPSIYVPSLKFVGLPVRMILDTYCVSINRPGNLDL